MRIALFVTCLADALFPDVGRATVTVLERLGHEVVFPAGQTCCGQMHINTGYQRQAVPLVRHYVDAFEGFDAIVAPSGSCVGSVRHQHPMTARRYGSAALATRAEALSLCGGCRAMSGFRGQIRTAMPRSSTVDHMPSRWQCAGCAALASLIR